jgi:WD40 repeat protein
MTTDLTGRVIRGYELREMLGMGGFGAVYRAHQAVVSREVAIKVILPAYANQPDFIRRFETEAQLVARLEHPFIVPLFDYWRDPDGAYLVMRLYRGGSLRSLLDIDSARLDNPDVLKLVDQIAGALAIAHRNNVIHRDLKPDNILLDEDRNAYLTDFGIARMTARGEDDEEEGLAGSPGYMSPEQITQQPVTPQTDIYSLGVILYELLTGKHPFPDSSTTELIFKHLQEPLPDLTSQDLPYELNEVIQRATAKDPAERYPDALALAGALRAALSTGTAALDDRFVTGELELLTVNPYKGLHPFEEVDAVDFFGRESLVAQLVARLSPPDALRFLAVVGPSGSGKSSVVKAGLIPALRWGEVPGSEHWFIVEMVPGSTPLEQLEEALLRVAYHPGSISDQLRADGRGLVEAARRVLPEGGELLLFIDQFEEVFTLVESEAERTRFLNLLRTAATEADSPVRIVVTLRADFYDRPLLYEGFGALMRASTEVVLPLSPLELERAITGPAERVGLLVEPNLLAAIVSDVREEPGALPLLEYVLTEVYERREGRTLTLAGYEASGGALGALARRADELYTGLDERHRSAVRQLFLRLVTLGEGTEDTRRRVLRSELMEVGENAPQALQDVLDLFGKYRLLSFDRDAQTREPTIEVAHEALIREWKLLREWLAASREDVRLQRNLAAAAVEWVNSGHEDSFLLRDYRLTQFENWVAETDIALTQSERTYLAASIAQQERLRAQEAERLAKERSLERRARLGLLLLVVALTFGFIGTSVLSAFALNQREIAQDERNNAQTQQAIAQSEAAISHSLALSARASQLESIGSHELALALIIEANNFPAPPDQSQRVLAEIAYAPGIIARLSEFDEGQPAINSVTFSPDGRYLLSASEDRTLSLWDLSTRQKGRSFSGHALTVSSAVFSPDGKTALSGSWDSRLILWDVETGEPLREFIGQGGIIRAVVMTPDGQYALSGSTNGVALWDIERGTIARSYNDVDSVFSLALSPDGKRVLVGTEDSGLFLIDVETGEIIHELVGHTSAVLSSAFSPDGTKALSGARDNSLIVWDLNTGQSIRRLTGGHSQPVNGIAYLPDGLQALTVSDDLSLILWNMETYQVTRRFGGAGRRGEHSARVTSVAVNPDGLMAATGGADDAVILWSIEGGAQLNRYHDHSGSVNHVQFAPFSNRIFSTSDDGTALMREIAAGDTVQVYMDDNAAVLTASLSPDERWVAGGLADNTVVIWNADSGEVRHRLAGHTGSITALAFSPDSAYLVSGADDNTLILWDVQTGEALRTLTGHSRRVLSVAYAPDGNTILSGSFDRTLILWDAATGQPLHRLEGHTRRVLSVAYSPDSRYALSGSDDGSIILWDLTTGRVVRRYGGSDEAIFTVAYALDGKTALSGSEQGTLTLWDLTTGQAVRRFNVNDNRASAGPPTAITSIAYGADSALTGLRDGQVIRWQMPTLPGLIAWTRANRYVPEFTCEERELYNIPPLCEETFLP